MSEIQRSLFDYSALAPDVAREAMATAERIKLRLRRTAEDLVEIGRELTEQKARLGHGNFLPWIEAEFGMSYQSANKFMLVFEKFGKSPIIGDFKPTVLSLLASAPEPAITAVTARAEAGEKIDVKAVRAEIEKAKAEATQAVAEAERVKAPVPPTTGHETRDRTARRLRPSARKPQGNRHQNPIASF